MKKLIIILPALALLGVAVWQYGLPAFHQRQAARCLAQARQALEQGDFRAASDAAGQALQHRPDSVAACRLLAAMAEAIKSPYAVDWWRKIAELEPTAHNRLAVAAASLRFQHPPYSLAAVILDDIPELAGKKHAYHAVAAERLLLLGQVAAAEQHLQEWVRLRPEDLQAQMNLAVARRLSGDSARMARGEQDLQRLAQNSDSKTNAWHWLASTAFQAGQANDALASARELAGNPGGTVNDRLLHLTMLQASSASNLTTELAAVQRGAGTNALTIYEVADWMSNHDLAQQAYQWLTNLPAAVQAQPPVPLGIADALLMCQNRTNLEIYLRRQTNWGAMEFWRLAGLARVQASASRPLAQEEYWRHAVRQAGEHLGPHLALLRLAYVAGWMKEWENQLWNMDRLFPGQKWALRELNRHYFATADMLGIYKVATALEKADPGDIPVKNNLAAISLLLKKNLRRAHLLAVEAYYRNPQEPAICATYAYSLHMQAKTIQGLAVLEQLSAAQLEEPGVALYYGVLLATAGDSKKARRFLDLAKTGNLLPEEKILLAEEERKIIPVGP